MIARRGDLFVVLNTTFFLLDVTPDNLDATGQLAATALNRLVEAA